MNPNTESSTPHYLSLVMRRWPVVVYGVVFCAALAAAVSLTSAKTYESSATVLISPPIFKESVRPSSETMSELAELMPRTLPMETYRILAESKWMFAEIKANLESRNFDVSTMKVEDIQKKCRIQLGELGSKTPQYGVRYSRAMVFIAKANTPELAAAVVQEWVELFKKKVDGLTKVNRDDTMELVEQMWRDAKEDLEDEEDLIELFDVKWNLPLMQLRMEQRQQDLKTFESQLEQLKINIAAESASLQEIQKELKQENKKETLFKAPSDDVILLLNRRESAVSTDESKTLGPQDGFFTEHLNPNYTKFRELEISSLSKLQGLKAQQENVLAAIDRLDNDVQQLREDVTEQTTVKTRLVRDKDNYEERYKLVARNLEASKLAKLNEGSDIKIAADAIPAGRSSGVGSKAKVASAAIVGALLSIGYIVASASLTGTLPEQTADETAT